MPTLKLIIAEDNPRDRQYLANLLAQHQLSFAVTGNEALRLARNHDPSFLLTDVQMPDLNGIGLAKALWQQQPTARVVFWSQHRDEMYIRAVAKMAPLEAAYGYVLKENEDSALLKALEAVFCDQQCWIDPGLKPVQARLHHKFQAVSDFEYEVLVDIAIGLTDNMIAKRRYLSRRGVQNRLSSLYAKLGIAAQGAALLPHAEMLNMRSRAIALALHRGLINAFELENEERKFQTWLKTLS